MIEKILNILNKYENILILWFGREWKTSYNFIRKHLPNKHLTILDENQIWEIDDKNTEILIEKITIERLRQFDLIVKTPWISFKWMDAEWLNITSQLELLLEIDRENVIAITGTKGKSTTTTLLYDVIKNQKENTFLLWNIWVPIFEQIEKFDEDSTLVIECSSHQLQYVKASPHIAILLNLYPEHLDHYNNLQEYYDSKLNIFKYQNENDFAIIDEQVFSVVPLLKGDTGEAGEDFYQNTTIIWKDIFIEWNFIVQKDIPLTKGDKGGSETRWWTHPTLPYEGRYDILLTKGGETKPIYDINEKRNLLWDHNLRNIMNIFVVCEILWLNFEKAKKIISEFQPLEHRMELVWTFDWITYYNDSIATIPESTINSLKSIPNVNTVIIWWMDRWIPYNKLIDFLNNSNIQNIICLPDTWHKIMPELSWNTYKANDLAHAVQIAKQVTQKWQVCLLSPAATSYWFFKNFEERGRIFKELVKIS